MHLSVSHSFVAPVERIFGLFTDPEFLAAVCRDVGGRRHSVAVSPASDGVLARLSVDVDTPGPLAALAGPVLTVGQDMTWRGCALDGSRDGALLITVRGLPVVVDAVATLAPTASGSVVDYAGTLVVDVPFVGPLIEKSVASFVLEALETQRQTAVRWLAG